jgi:hypothetical protein
MTMDARPQSQWEFHAFLLQIKMAYKNSHFLSVNCIPPHYYMVRPGTLTAHLSTNMMGTILLNWILYKQFNMWK